MHDVESAGGESTGDDHRLPVVSPADKAEMEKYGITRVVIDCFHGGEYRYTKLADAVAEAQRQRASNVV
jgi:hypothetical protein